MFTNPEMYYNSCQKYYEKNHIYIPDDVGYADGRISIQVVNDNVEYFPDDNVWRLNKTRVFGVYEIFDKLELGDEEPLFWACLKRSVGSERCHFNWPELLCPSFDFDFSDNSDSEDPNEIHFEDISMRSSCKEYEDALKPLIGEITCVGSNRDYHIYTSKKYGTIKMSKRVNWVKRSLVFEESDRFPKTAEYLSKHPLFIGE